MLNGIDEEQAQHLDALRSQAQFLVQMLLDGPPDHKLLNCIAIHVADRLTHAQRLLLIAQFDILLAGFAADVLHKVVGIYFSFVTC